MKALANAVYVQGNAGKHASVPAGVLPMCDKLQTLQSIQLGRAGTPRAMAVLLFSTACQGCSLQQCLQVTVITGMFVLLGRGVL